MRDSEPRIVHRYESIDPYPTDNTLSVIQGIVTAVMNLISNKEFGRKISAKRSTEVYVLIRTFRNLVEHCQEKASEKSLYREKRYVD